MEFVAGQWSMSIVLFSTVSRVNSRVHCNGTLTLAMEALPCLWMLAPDGSDTGFTSISSSRCWFSSGILAATRACEGRAVSRCDLITDETRSSVLHSLLKGRRRPMRNYAVARPLAKDVSFSREANVPFVV